MLRKGLLLSLLISTFCLTACQRDLTTIGQVNMDNLITPDMVAEMGYESFREQYLGQEVTITGFNHQSLIGAYRPANTMCEVAFSLDVRDPPPQRFHVSIYTNHHPDFVLEDLFGHLDQFDADLLPYGNEFDLPEAICDEHCQWDEEDPDACFYKSPRLVISGKPFMMTGGDDGNVTILGLKVSGVSY